MPPKVAGVWEVNSLVLEGHTGSIGASTFSSCGKYLATCAYEDRTLRVWDSATGDCILKIPLSKPGRPVAVSFSHDNKFLAAAYVEHEYPQGDFVFLATIYDTQTGNAMETYVCTEAWCPRYPRAIRLVFAPGLSNTLFVALIPDMGPNGLEVWCTKLASHKFEKAWGIPTGIQQPGYCIISASNSLVSCFLQKDRNIIFRRLDSGAYVSSHTIDLDDDYFEGFIDHQGRDLVYYSRSEVRSTDDGKYWLKRPRVHKLNTQTGQVDFITYIEKTWFPTAMSLKTGAMAYTKQDTGVVYMIDLLQCPKTDTLTPHKKPLESGVSVSQNGEMILIVRHEHIELRDVLGDTVFRSPKVNNPEYGKVASVSYDGSVVVARLRDAIHVWFVKSGKELQLQLPHMDWLCSPAVSHDVKSMALYLLATNDPDWKHKAISRLKYTLVNRILLWDLENDQEVKVVEESYTPSSPPAWVLFSENDKTLHTDKGDLDLETGDWRTDNVHGLDKLTKSISDDLSWLQSNGEDMLWLPESYRPRNTWDRFDECFGKNTIAYCCQGGSIVVMQCIDPCE
jgi:WD40 repeat protein